MVNINSDYKKLTFHISPPVEMQFYGKTTTIKKLIFSNSGLEKNKPCFELPELISHLCKACFLKQDNQIPALIGKVKKDREAIGFLKQNGEFYVSFDDQNFQRTSLMEFISLRGTDQTITAIVQEVENPCFLRLISHLNVCNENKKRSLEVLFSSTLKSHSHLVIYIQGNVTSHDEVSKICSTFLVENFLRVCPVKDLCQIIVDYAVESLFLEAYSLPYFFYFNIDKIPERYKAIAGNIAKEKEDLIISNLEDRVSTITAIEDKNSNGYLDSIGKFCSIAKFVLSSEGQKRLPENLKTASKLYHGILKEKHLLKQAYDLSKDLMKKFYDSNEL